MVRDFARQFVEVRRGEVEGVSAWLAQGRLDLVARLGHQIKGTAPTFGLPEIGAAGARLEAAARAGDAEEVAGQVAVLLELMRPGQSPP